MGPTKYSVRGVFWKFWNWRNISVTSNFTCQKIIPYENILFVYIHISRSFYVTWRSDWKSTAKQPYPQGSDLTSRPCTWEKPQFGQEQSHPFVSMTAQGIWEKHEIHHNLDKSSLIHLFRCLLKVYSSANMPCKYGEMTLYKILFA